MVMELKALITQLVCTICDFVAPRYRPELHYMRGPGPAWHAKHDPAPAPSHAAPALARMSTR
jgi:hypothetical protein